MLYKIALDETHYEDVNLAITLPGQNGGELYISLRLQRGQCRPYRDSISADYVRKPDVLADVVETTGILDCQEALVHIIRALMDNGVASYAGIYRKGARKIPVFRGDGGNGLYVDSIDKKTGRKLLEGSFMKNPERVSKLATWVASRFPLVSQWAGEPYPAAHMDEACLIRVLIQAAQFLREERLRPSAHE